MELGESFEECAVREAYEETGLKCKDLQYFTNMSGKEMHYVYPNEDEVYIAEIVFICREYSGNLKVQKSEVIEQRFFDLDKLPDNLSPINVKVLNQLAKEEIYRDN